MKQPRFIVFSRAVHTVVQFQVLTMEEVCSSLLNIVETDLVLEFSCHLMTLLVESIQEPVCMSVIYHFIVLCDV